MSRLRARPVVPVGPVVDEPVRTLVVWVPDWPLVAAGVAPEVPAAVFVANRVVAATAAARSAGVRRHMRRREAQSRCPSLEVLAADPERDVRAFEPVVLALEALTPRLEVTRPGRCAFPTRGPSRYFGGDRALGERAAELVRDAVAEITGTDSTGPDLIGTGSVGVADGPFAAQHAARAARRDPAGVHVVALEDDGEGDTFSARMRDRSRGAGIGYNISSKHHIVLSYF